MNKFIEGVKIFIANVLLAAVFFLVFAVIGAILRAFAIALRMKIDKKALSYWLVGTAEKER